MHTGAHSGDTRQQQPLWNNVAERERTGRHPFCSFSDGAVDARLHSVGDVWVWFDCDPISPHMLNLFRSNLHNKSLIMCCRLSYGEVNCTELDYIGIRYVLLLHEFSLALFYLHEFMYALDAMKYCTPRERAEARFDFNGSTFCACFFASVANHESGILQE